VVSQIGEVVPDSTNVAGNSQCNQLILVNLAIHQFKDMHMVVKVFLQHHSRVACVEKLLKQRPLQVCGAFIIGVLTNDSQRQLQGLPMRMTPFTDIIVMVIMCLPSRHCPDSLQIMRSGSKISLRLAQLLNMDTITLGPLLSLNMRVVVVSNTFCSFLVSLLDN
jgi:hypothetical protein